MHKNNFFLLLILLTGSGTLLAETTTEPASPALIPAGEMTLGQLEQLYSENLLLEAQVQGAQLQRQLKESGSSDSPVQDTTLPPLPMQATQPVPRRVTSLRPTIMEISGRGQRLKASVQIPGGGIAELETGSRLPGTSLSVSRITESSVILSDGSVLTF